jgi:hypothetical protein
MKTLKIKMPLSSVHHEKIIELFHQVWNTEKNSLRSKTIWAFQNPESIIFTAFDVDKLIAVRGGFPWNLQFEDKIIRAFQLHGTCVHPDYRRIGLFSTLTRQFVEELTKNNQDLIFNVSVKASRLGYEKMGWVYLKGFHRLTFINNPLKLFKKRGLINSGTIEMPVQFVTEIDNKLLEYRNLTFKNLIHTFWDSDLLNWRLSNQKEGYRIAANEKGAVIYKIVKNGLLRKMIIGDYFLYNNCWSSFRNINKHLFKLEKPDLAYTYIFSTHPYYNYMLMAGFLPNPFNYHLNFGVRPLNAKLNYSKAKWALSFIDIDTF